MDFITASMASGLVYDFLKNGFVESVNRIKSSFKGWVLTDELAKEILDRIEHLNINEDMSEKAIKKVIENDQKFSEILSRVKVDSSVQVNQSVTNSKVVNNIHNNSIGDNSSFSVTGIKNNNSN